MAKGWPHNGRPCALHADDTGCSPWHHHSKDLGWKVDVKDPALPETLDCHGSTTAMRLRQVASSVPVFRACGVSLEKGKMGQTDAAHSRKSSFTLLALACLPPGSSLAHGAN